MEEKPNDDEIPNYITELNTVRAKQENSSKKRTIPSLTTHKQDPISNNIKYSRLLNTLLIFLTNYSNFSTKYLYGGVL